MESSERPAGSAMRTYHQHIVNHLMVIKHQALEHPILFVLLCAAVLRVWGIWHGYPFSYYPDERHFINRAMAFGSGDLNPHWYHKPAFLMYLLFFEYSIFFALGWVTGIFSDTTSFAVYYLQHPWPFILIGRVTVAIFGVATVFAVYKIGELLWSRTAGLFAAIFLTFSFGHIFSGQDVKADVPTTLFTMIASYYLLRAASREFHTRDYLLAGLFAGLGTATKYYTIVLLPCILFVSAYEVITRKQLSAMKKFIYALLAFWGMYFVASPFNFLDPLGRRSTFSGLIAVFNLFSPVDLRTYAPLEGSEEIFLAEHYKGNYLLHSLTNYFEALYSTDGVGAVITIVFAAALCFALYKSTLKSMFLLSFPVLFSMISILLAPSYTEPRHQLIIYPFLAVAAGFMLASLSAMRRAGPAVTVTLMLFLLWPLHSIVERNIYNARGDTRSVAKYWIESNIPAGTKILLDRYSPVLSNNVENLTTYAEKAAAAEKGQFTAHLDTYFKYKILATSGVTYDINEIRHPWWRRREIQNGEVAATTEFDKDMANPIKLVGVDTYTSYKKEGYVYLITTNYAYDTYLDENSWRSVNFPFFAQFYRDLFSQGSVMKEFDPMALGLQGPVVKVIKIQ